MAAILHFYRTIRLERLIIWTTDPTKQKLVNTEKFGYFYTRMAKNEGGNLKFVMISD